MNFLFVYLIFTFSTGRMLRLDELFLRLAKIYDLP